QDLCTLPAGLIENEIRVGIAVRIIAPVVEELFVQTLLRRGFQKSRRNNLIGIDVINGQPHHAALEIGKGFHDTRVLTSLTVPERAEAAAVRGEARNVLPPLPCRPSKLRLLVETL